MPRFRHSLVVLAVAAAAVTACSDGTAPANDDVTDTSLATDLAASAGDAIATDVSDMVENEQFSSASADVTMDATTSENDDLTRSRTRTCYPWPVSGQFIRNVDATFTVTRGATKTRTISRRAVVTFPADAQGNVPIELGTLSCTLNLVTRRVTECTGS